MTASSLIAGLLFGSVGLGYVVYGKKQRALTPLVCGLALMAAPYLVPGTVALMVVGAALVAVPCFVRV